MGWSEKHHPSTLDTQPIHGLYFLDGDLLARTYQRPVGTEGQKYPQIAFPSGLHCALWEQTDPNNATVHIFGELDLALRQSPEDALTQAVDIAEQVGYFIRRAGANTFEVLDADGSDTYRISYDPEQSILQDVELIRAERPRPTRIPLLDEKTREKLPKLYSQESEGLNALAQAKFFTPDSSWTWYASEFDGEDVFFGLVSGDDLELGYFSLSELESVRGPLGLSIERDRYFTPKTLGELKAKHERERRGDFD